jgi:hypothetical protein
VQAVDQFLADNPASTGARSVVACISSGPSSGCLRHTGTFEPALTISHCADPEQFKLALLAAPRAGHPLPWPKLRKNPCNFGVRAWRKDWRKSGPENPDLLGLIEVPDGTGCADVQRGLPDRRDVRQPVVARIYNASAWLSRNPPAGPSDPTTSSTRKPSALELERRKFEDEI